MCPASPGRGIVCPFCKGTRAKEDVVGEFGCVECGAIFDHNGEHVGRLSATQLEFVKRRRR